MIEDDKAKTIDAIKKKYGDGYHDLKWINEEEAKAGEAERYSIIDSLTEHLSFGYNGTKPYYIGISPGCRHCGEGTWSCLFINGKCNGSCFFCPSEQSEIGDPVTNALQFINPNDYLDYIDIFKIRGISISGGEPLLTLDKSINFISAVQHRFGDEIHKWLYTNGILLTEEALIRLRDAGLNEIRLNLVAQNYNIEKVKLASRYIDTVTVEIPAIPEDYERLCNLLPKVIESGVKYLNLHQLRCTTYNYNKFIKRGYTFLHGPDVTVLESELVALKVIKYAADSGLRLPINYCSFVYRNNFQRIGARKRSASYMVKPYEGITNTGMIRSLQTLLTGEEVGKITAFMRENSEPESSIYYEPKSAKLSFSDRILKYINIKAPVTISYFDSMLNNSTSYMNVFKEIKLNNRKKITAERWRALPDIVLDTDEFLFFKNIFLDGVDPGRPLPASDKWAVIDSMEEPHKGLQDYW